MSAFQEELARLEEIAALEAKMASRAKKEPGPSYGLKAAGMMAKDMLVSGLAAIPQMLGAGPKAADGKPLPYNAFANLKGKADKFEKENSDLREISPFLHAGVQGAVTGGAFSPTNAARVASTAAGAAGGLGAEGGMRLGEQVGLPEAGALAGSLLTGGLAGFALGPRQSVAQRDLRLETRGLTPAQWAEVENNARILQKSGGSTATAAEAFPGPAGVKAMALDAATRDGGQVLRGQLAMREADLVNMGNSIPGMVDPRTVSLAKAVRSAAEGANTRLSQIKSATQRPLSNIGRMERSGQLPLISRGMAQQLVRDFETLAQAPNLPRSDALGRQDMVQAFLDPNAPPWARNVPNPKTGRSEPITQEGPQRALSSLLLNIAENTPSTSSASAKAGLTIPRAAENRARTAAFDTVNLMPDPYGSVAAKAGAAYRQRKEAWLTPAEEGPLRKIAGSRSPEGVQLAEARLSAIMDDALQPGKTEGIIKDLRKGGADTKMIARALVERELVDNPGNFAKTLTGQGGSLKARQFQEVLTGAGVPPAPILEKIAAGNLMDLRGTMTKKDMPDMLARQALLRPFRTLDMMMTQKSQAAINQEIAQLLKDPRNIPQIRKIAEFSPAVRAALTANASLLPGLQQGLARNEE